jgi:hypothetical protein
MIRKPLVVLLTFGVWGLAFPVAGQSSDTDSTWRPAATERLVRLPAGYMERAIEQDYRASGLAQAIERTGAQLRERTAGLSELQAMARTAEGPERDELRHRVLVEKRAYVDTMARRLELERERVETRVAVFERLLDDLERSAAPVSPQDIALEANRTAALERFEDSRARIDIALLKGGAVERSKYAIEYGKHADALQALSDAIDRHPMNAAPVLDGQPLDRKTHARRLLVAAETERALLEQRELVVSYMARLVALDAMALADEMAERESVERGRPEERDLTLAVDAFVK